MNYAEIKRFDVANAPGISSSIFFSGCKFNCKGCFNELAQSFNYGKPFTKEIEDLFISYLNHPEVVNASILGGEPFQQDLDILLNFVKRIKSETNVNIWMWSGYLFDDIIKDSKKCEILNHIDVLIDGRFILEQRNLSLKYRGSSNQRIINVKESLKQNKVVLYETK